MACNQVLSGIPRDCEGSIGGVKRVLFINHDQLGKVEITEETGIVSAITPTDSAKFFEYYPKKNTASFAPALTVGDGDNRSYQATLVLNFGKMTAAKRMQMQALLANELAAIVEDNNGTCWLVGKDVPLQATEGGGNTGTAMTDANAYTVTMTDMAKELHPTVDASIVAGLIG